MDQQYPSLLSIFAFSVFALASLGHAAFSPQVYWKTVLPHTQMPTALSELLHSGLVEEKTGTSVQTGKKGVNVRTNKGTTVGVGHGTVGVHSPGKPGGTGTDVNVGNGGVNVHTDPKNKDEPVIVHSGPFSYEYAANEDQVNANRDVAVFFVEKDIHSGKRFTLHFTRTATGAAFIPREKAENIPFSSKKLPEILSTFKIKSNSDYARTMETVLKECEIPAVEGETRACVTSLESMVDFSTGNIGTRDVVVRSTTVEEENAPKQVYTVSGVRNLKGDQDSRPVVACHAKPYVYAVFFCHKTKSTRIYEVKMTAADGSKVDAVAVCHTNTSKWNPKHLAFQLLNVKPGTVPVCHFLPQDHVVWTPTN